jgi:hypothetical protein
MVYPKQLFLFQTVCLFYTIFFFFLYKKKKKTKKKHKQFDSFIKIPPPNTNFASQQKNKTKENTKKKENKTKKNTNIVITKI